MLSRLIRFLTLCAVLLLPLGMAHAGATSPTQAASSHCEGMTGKPHDGSGKAMQGECTMACASALPASPAQFDAMPPLLAANALIGRVAVGALHGLILDIATPPPRGA